jgi:hypothetical protein
LLVLAVLGFFVLSPTVSQAHAQPSGVSFVYVSPLKISKPSNVASFTVGVWLNLTSGQRINQFDVRLVYSDPTVVRATSIDLSNNVFSSYSGTAVLLCKDGIIQAGTGCIEDDRLGTVHVIDTALSGTVPGPISALLFSVTFNVLNPGSSFFTFDIAHLFNPGSDLQNPKVTYVQEISEGGIFANAGIAAFYNYWPVNPPTVLLLSDTVFDASPSFDTAGSSISSYTWNFGDGSSPASGMSPPPHRFPSPGNYSVQLTVATQSGGSASVTRTVPVQAALGSLYLSVLDQLGSQIKGSARVQIFNYSGAPKSFQNKTTDFGGHVVFNGLVPGSYYLKFSGPNIVNNNATENISAGWQTLDTIYLKVVAPTAPSYFGDIVFGVSMVAGVGAFGTALFWKRRSDARKRQGKSPVRTGKAGTKSHK